MTDTALDSPPEWWSKAKSEIDDRIEKFSGSLSQKFDDFSRDPMKYIARKNPFLFRLRAKHDPEKFVESVLDAFVSSSEETMFGDLAEECALIMCKHAKQGRPSNAEGIDIEFDEGGVRYAVQVKSGPHWGNASQKKKLREQFQQAKKIYGQGGQNRRMICIEGHAYGRSKSRHEGNFMVLTGSEFWAEISGWRECSDALMQLIGEHAANGFESARQRAKVAGVRALEKEGVVNTENAIDWLRLHHRVDSKDKSK